MTFRLYIRLSFKVNNTVTSITIETHYIRVETAAFNVLFLANNPVKEIVFDTETLNVRIGSYPLKSIFDLEDIIKSGNFCMNTRIVKYILNCDFNSFTIFLERQSSDFVNHLYDLSLGNGYHTIEAYSENLNFIKNNLNNKKYKLI